MILREGSLPELEGRREVRGLNFANAVEVSVRGVREREVSHKREHVAACEAVISMRTSFDARGGKIGWILLWLLGVPIPILLILFLLRGCT